MPGPARAIPTVTVEATEVHAYKRRAPRAAAGLAPPPCLLRARPGMRDALEMIKT
jgi:hypothetical protein